MPFIPTNTQSNNETGGLVTYALLVDDTAVSESVEIVNIEIHQEINVITRATIVILDGEPDTEDFEISGSNLFLPGKTIEISLGYNSTNVKVFKGIIISNSQKASDNSLQLILECRDEAVKMTLDKSSKHFENQSATDIADALLSKYSITNKDITSSSIIHKQLVQFNSSDWDFMISRLDAISLMCVLNNGETKIKNISSGPENIEVAEFKFGDNIIEFEGNMDSRLQAENIKTLSWNYTTQEVEDEEFTLNILNDTGVTTDELGSGKTTTLRTGSKNEIPEQQALAKTKKLHEVLSKIKGKVRFFGRVANPVLPGDFIKLKGLGTNFNGNVFVSAIHHDYSDGNWITTATLGWNEKLFTEKINPASPSSSSGELSSVHGLQTGIITDIIDNDGDFRIKLRMPMVDNQQDGVFARLATLDAGSNRGTFFMPEVGDEVVVGFMNDDPNYPVILGMLHSSRNAAPLNPETDNDKKGYVSRSDIKILIDDGEKSITIETPGGNVFTMNDTENKITIVDSSSNKITMEQAGVTIESATILTLKAGTSLAISAPQLSMKSDGGLTIEGGGSTTIQSSGMLTIKGSMVNIN